MSGYNLKKARESGATDEQIVAYLKKTGRSDDEIKQVFKQERNDKIRPWTEAIGQNVGQYAGGLLGAGLGASAGGIGAIPGAITGRFAGGTIGNVAGSAAPEMVESQVDALKYLATLGRKGQIKAPKIDVARTGRAVAEGAQASALGEAIPGAFKLGGKLRRAVSPDTGFLKGLTQISEALTGQPANEFKNIVGKPRALLYRWMGGHKGASRAWEGFTETLENKGIDPSDVEFAARETTSSIKNSVFDLMDMQKVTKGKMIKQLPTAHVIKMMRATQDVIGDPATTRGFGELKNLRTALVSELEGRSDDIAKAWKDVANSELSKSFHTPAFGLLPKMGEKAQGYKAFYEIRRMLPFLIAGSGAASGHPELAGLGAIFSPLMMGIPFAAGGAAVKGALNPNVVASGVKALQKWRGAQND